MVANGDNLTLNGGDATRPIIMGRHMVVASGHHLASLIGMRMYDIGGNAFDVGVAMCFAQALLEFHNYGFGGEIPMLLYSAKEDKVISVNGNMAAPAAATIEEFRKRGVTDVIAGDGLLAAGVCAAPSALINVLDRYGTLTLKEVLTPAIELATEGFPISKGFAKTIKAVEGRFKNEWTSSANLFMPDGVAPEQGDIWKNPDLGRVWEKLIEAEKQNCHLGRSAGLQAAIDRFYRGDIAKQIVKWQQQNSFKDQNGVVSNGLLTEADFALFETKFEEPVMSNYKGYDVYKCAPWSQGPVLLQTLNILEAFDLQKMGHLSADYIHTLSEAQKLAFSDREKYYGDPNFVDVPLTGLLSKAYATERRKLIDMSKAATTMRPGNPYPYQGSDLSPDLTQVFPHHWGQGTTGTRVIDKDGNMFSATPSGGWFNESPIIDGLGFCLGTRMQTFWLKDPTHPGALKPYKRPRTTLTPTIVMKDGHPFMCLGSPGGDQQDQWTLQVLLNIIEFGMDVQDAIDATSFHIEYGPSSFYPREFNQGTLHIENRLDSQVLSDLAARGHLIKRTEAWSQNFTTAVIYDRTRHLMQGGASSRRETMYALGW